MFDVSPLTPDDRQFLANVAALFRRATAAKNKDKTMLVAIPTGDETLIAERLERIAEFGDSGTEIGRVAI